MTTIENTMNPRTKRTGKILSLLLAAALISLISAAIIPVVNGELSGEYGSAGNLIGTSQVVLVYLSPVAGFTYTPLTSFAPLAVTFTDTSVSMVPVTSWSWDFGDGTSSTLQNPVHSYAVAGTGTVVLHIIDTMGGHTVFTRNIIVNAPAAPSSSSRADDRVQAAPVNPVVSTGFPNQRFAGAVAVLAISGIILLFLLWQKKRS